MRSLRARLFVAILGSVLVAVGASLALGVVLTKNAVRETIRRDVERQAAALASQVGRPGGFPSPAVGPPPGAARFGAGPFGRPPAGAPEGRARPVQVLAPEAAARLLPPAAAAELRQGRAVEGTARIEGESAIFAARPSAGGRSAVLVTRPDVVSGDDLRRYVSALLIASGVAALLAAAVAALLSRRLTLPLRRLSAAAGELAAGRRPEPVPRAGTEELDELAGAFDEMSDQLATAREAERAVLMSVSHELRTPLTSIRGYAEGIEDGTVEPRQAAAVVGREAARLERLVGDLLALARLRQGAMEVEREPVDLAAVAREAEERLRPRAAEGGVEVRLAVVGTAAATADHGRVLQVVSNLLENAIRVSPAGGVVEVRTSAGELSVSDQGPGIPEEEVPLAFERFRLRARAGRGSADGAGLGLAIVRDLTEAMGGSAWVENLPSRGARFGIRLPV